MRPRTLRTIQAGMLGVALGVLVMTGAAAAIAFPTMKALQPSLPEFASYPSDHHRIAAGQVMARVFRVAEAALAATLVVAIIAFTLDLVRASRQATVLERRVRAARGVLYVGMLAIMGFKFGVLNPRMNAELGAFWSDARAGNVQAADAHRAAFDADHPTASKLLYAQAVLVALALLVCVAPVGGDVPERRKVAL